MIRCSECQKAIIPITKYQHWLKVVNFLEFLSSEEYITPSTYQDLQDSMMSMKEWCENESE